MIRLAGLTGPPASVAFTPDGRELVTGHATGGDCKAVWWDWASGTVARRVSGPALAVGADGAFVSTVEPAGRRLVVRVFAAGDPEPLGVVPTDYRSGLPAHRVGPGGTEVLVQHADGLRAHRLPGGATVARLPAAGQAWALGYSPSGRWRVGGVLGWVRVWDPAGGGRPVLLPADDRGLAAVSADDRFAAVSGPVGPAVTVWELGSRADGRRLPLPAPPRAVAWVPDGRLLVAVEAGPVRVWDVDARREVGQLDVGGPVCGLAVAPDGLTAAAGVAHPDGTGGAVVWDL